MTGHHYPTSVTRQKGEWFHPTKVIEHPDADVVTMGDDRAGTRAMLRIPTTDPETGDKYDVDGDLAVERVTMIVSRITLAGDGLVVVTGVVEDRDKEDAITGYHFEQWRVRPRL